MKPTKDWLQLVIAAMEARRDEVPFGTRDYHDMTLEALKMALAVLEQDMDGLAFYPDKEKQH